MENPAFGLTQTGTDTTGMSTQTDSATTAGPTSSATVESSSDPTSTSDATTSSSDATTDTTTTDDPTLPSDTETSTSDSGDTDLTSDTEPVQMGMLEIEADLATCVLLQSGQGQPYAGPDECENIVSEFYGQPTGAIVTDVSYFDGGGAGREAWLYIRCSWPTQLDGAQLLDLSLTMTVFSHQDYFGADNSGVLSTTSPFDKASLTMAPAPPLLEVAADKGPSNPGQVHTWDLDPGLWQPGNGLFLMLTTASDEAVLYRSSAAQNPAVRPQFRVTYLK